MKDPFIIRVPNPDPSGRRVIKTSARCYNKLEEIKRRTGIALGPLVEKCVDFALDRLEINYGEGEE